MSSRRHAAPRGSTGSGFPNGVPRTRTLFAIGLAALIALALVLTACGSETASSPSDVEIAYSVTPEQAPLNAGIYLVDREGKHRTRLTRPTAPDAQDVAWSPTSDLLLFHSLSGEAWTVRSDGSDLRKIGAGEASWAPDGRMIAVASKDRVEIVSADGQRRTTIATESIDIYFDSAPSWSPDGTRIAFSRSSGKGETPRSAVFIAPVNGGGGAVPLLDPATHDVHDHDPLWSPDGTLLAFEEIGSDPPWISVSRADGSERKRVMAANAYLYGWMPDGKAVICRDAYPDSPLAACPLDGSLPRRLTPNEERMLQASSRSPDGSRTATVDVGGAIVVTESDGSSTVITNPAVDTLPDWSRDGMRLAFIRAAIETGETESESWVYVINRNGRGVRRVGLGDSASWLPGDQGMLVRRSGYGDGDSLGTTGVALAGKTRPLVDKVHRAAVAPDGTIAYVRMNRAKGTAALYVIKTRGGAERKVADIPAPASQYITGLIYDLAVGADRQTLFAVWPVRVADTFDMVGTLHELTLQGRSTVLARGVAGGNGIAVSPDGGQVAFVTGRGLEVVELDSGKQRVLVSGSTDPITAADPRWSPDGSVLAYLTERFADTSLGLEVVSSDGSERHRISAPGQIVDSFSWRPALTDR